MLPSAQPTQKLRVSVIIPTYRRVRLLDAAITSVLLQAGQVVGQDFEIIVVSDGDEAAKPVVQKYAPFVKYYRLPKNEGQSAVLNFALAVSSAPYLMVQHDDDLARPEKIGTLADYLDQNPDAGIVCALSGCVNADGSVNTKHHEKRLARYRERGLEGPNLINQRYVSYVDGAATMYRREMIESIGGWNKKLPHGEEVDIHIRACMKGWRIGFVDKIVADYRVHGTESTEAPNKSLIPNGSGSLRQSAYECGRKMRSRFRDDILIAISSVAERAHGLRKTVESLISQCDRMNVYLLGYSEVPKWLDTWNGKLGVFVQDDPAKDRGTAEKFSWVDGHKGYYITCDDDIIYPKDYVERLVQGIERHGRKAICGFHGAQLTSVPVSDYYRDRRVYHFKDALTEDTPVDVIGNVCGGFHTSALKLTAADFIGGHSQDDIYLAAKAKQAGVPVICLRHPGNWIRPNLDIDQTNSIFNRYSKHPVMAREIASTLNAAFAKEPALA